MADEQKLTANAHADFLAGKYNNCLQNITQILSQRPNDVKVLHNKAVIDFYISGHKAVEAFQKSITQICSQTNVAILENDAPEDVEHCVLYFNQAIIFYLQKDYNNALSVINKAFTLIQPMEETLAHKLCLLLLELSLLCGQVEKAHSHIEFIENQFISTKSSFPKGEKDLNEKEVKDSDASTDAFRLKLLYYKVKANVMSKSFDACLKDLEDISTLNPDIFRFTNMKARCYYLSNNFETGLKTFTAIQENTDTFMSLSEENRMVYFNNLACLYHNLGKSSLCTFFMTKAMSIYKTEILKIGKSKDTTYSRNSLIQPSLFPLILYNRGVALLYTNKPSEAFECFTDAVQLMPHSALVWLRLAECCIMFYRPGNEEHFNFVQKRHQLVTDVLGKGTSKKIVLNNKIYKDTAYSCEPQSYAVPLPNLDFAVIAARNALALLPKDNNKLRHAALAATAYIHLSIGDAVKAYEYSNLLFKDTTTSPIYKYLSRLYVAESLVMLSRVKEAIETLSSVTFADEDPKSVNLLFEWYPKTSATAHAVLQYNLAAALTIQGDFEKAGELLRHIWVSKGPKGDVPIHVIALALYIELILGHVDVARTIIRQNCPHIV